MDISMFEQFVSPLALAGAFVVGYVIKHAVPTDTVNRFIPMICAVVGMLVACFAAFDVTAELLVQGAVSGLGATGLYEAYKGATERIEMVTSQDADE